MWTFARSPSAPPPSQPIELVESLSGNWFYHLALAKPTAGASGPRQALCGSTHIMSSPGQLRHWGYRDHLNERYCAACEKAAHAAGWGGLLGL